MRTINEIINAAVINTLARLRNEKPIPVVIKLTGNKKALNQKSKNKVNIWS
jgi:hypothetical protein